MAQFQAKESTEIPDEVYEKILLEIKKERIVKLENLTTKKIRQYLKKIKMNKYYDHSAHILYHINGIQPPNMSKDLEENDVSLDTKKFLMNLTYQDKQMLVELKKFGFISSYSDGIRQGINILYEKKEDKIKEMKERSEES